VPRALSWPNQKRSQEHQQTEHHGQRVKLHHARLQRTQQVADLQRYLGKQVDQAINNPPVHDVTELRKQPQGPDEQQVVQLVEVELAVREQIQRPQATSEPIDLGLVP